MDPENQPPNNIEMPNPSQQFHWFPRLPTELRWRIWEMAIRTDQTPKLHYYTLYNNDDGVEQQSLLQQLMRYYHPVPPVTRLWIGPRLMTSIVNPPMKSRPSECSWTEANRFLYFWDAGLQTACRESRAALLEHSRLAKRRQSKENKNKIPLKRFRPPIRRQPKHNDVVTTRHRGEKVYLRVSSKRDIICFRFAPQDMSACVSMRWDVLLPRLPFFHLPYATDINIALEFDDSWNEGLGTTRESIVKYLPEVSDRGMAMRAMWAWRRGEIPRWARLWLIDRSGQLPASADKYQLPGKDDGRYRYGMHQRQFPCEPEAHHVFTDGEDTYVESYEWEGRGCWLDVPVLNFMWKLRVFCRPAADDELFHAILERPFTDELFLKVLHRLPGGTG